VATLKYDLLSIQTNHSTQKIISNFYFITNVVQSAGRDFGSPSETDYVVLQQTKERARELIIEWIIDAALEEPTVPPTVDPEDTTTTGPIPAHDRQPIRNF
jgi:hypothetical protein